MADFETDYLIVGAGAVGLAFADTLLDEDPDCHITFVDKHAKPGGHWNDAYGFVALHQPSATYGVNSMAFESEQLDTHGPNKGLHALASGTEVLAYFEKVMNMRLLPSGRVAYHRLCSFDGRDDDGVARISSIFSDSITRVKVRRKLVDATFYQTSVPSTHKRSFSESGDVTVVPPGELPHLWRHADNLPEHYAVLGAGKTAMDTVVWLLQAGINPDNISWVRPRDSWLWNREYVQPGEAFFEAVIELQTAMLDAAIEAKDSAELNRHLGEQDYYLRIDPEVQPEMFHFAVISRGEIELLRQVKKVIRDGHVQTIEPGKLVFAHSEVAVPAHTLFIDCTATAVPFSVRDENQGPIFRGDSIVLQPLQTPLVVLSAAIAAFIEAHFDDDETRNSLATPAPLTDSPSTFAYSQMINMLNRGAWGQHPNIMEFLARSRLDLASGTIAKLTAENSPKLKVVAEFRAAIERGIPSLFELGTKAKALHEAQ
ncbi:MAG: NAD(P)/FAD-dependent oxidoreductase [Congregibacter sp.]